MSVVPTLPGSSEAPTTATRRGLEDRAQVAHATASAVHRRGSRVVARSGGCGARGALRGLARGEQHRVPDGRERRRVGEVVGGELVGGRAGVQRRGDDVDALGDALAADELPAEQAARAALGDELDPQRLVAGVVARAREVRDRRADGVEAGGGRLALGEARAADVQVADLDDGGPEHAGERVVAAGDVRPRDAALLVRGRPERDVRGAVVQQVARLAAVAGGPDPVDRACASRSSTRIAAVRAEREARGGRERAVGPHADADDDDVGGDRLAARDDRRARARRRRSPRPPTPQRTSTSLRASSSATVSATSASTSGKSRASRSTTVVARPRSRNASAISSPM